MLYKKAQEGESQEESEWLFNTVAFGFEAK